MNGCRQVRAFAEYFEREISAKKLDGREPSILPPVSYIFFPPPYFPRSVFRFFLLFGHLVASFLPHHSFIFLFPFLLPFFTENSIARFCFLLSPSFAHTPFQEEDRRAYVGQLPVLSPSLSRMLLWTFLSLSLLPLFSHPFSFSPRFNGCTRVRSPRLQEASSGSDWKAADFYPLLVFFYAWYPL